MTKQRVFIGTHRSFQALTKVIYDYLTDRDFEVYYHFSEDINHDFDKNIKSQQLSCDCLILPVTALGLRVYGYTNHYRLMVETALKHQQIIIPLMYGDDSWDAPLIKAKLPDAWYSLLDYEPIQISADVIRTTLSEIQLRIQPIVPTHSLTTPKSIFPLSILDYKKIRYTIINEHNYVRVMNAVFQKDYGNAETYIKGKINSEGGSAILAHNWHDVSKEWLKIHDSLDGIEKFLLMPKSEGIFLVDLYLKRDYINIFTYADSIIRREPNNCFNYYILGMASIKQKRYDEAYQALCQCLKLHPEFADAYSARATVYKEWEQYEHAILDLTSAIRIEPDNANYLLKRGQLYSQENQVVRALKDYEHILQLQPESIETMLRIARLQATLFQTDAALRYINKAIAINRHASLTYALRGDIYVMTEQYEKALVDYQMAIDLGDSSYDAYMNRGTAYGHLGQYDKAIDDLTKVTARDWNRDDAFFHRATVYADMERYNSAVADISRAIKRDSDNPSYYAYRAWTYMTLEKYAKARDDFEKVLQLDPKSKSAVDNLAQADALHKSAGGVRKIIYNLFAPSSDKQDGTDQDSADN
ncbi:MAG: tetratricopeptide repeat protein [Chloroflexota bacterium]